MIWRIRHKSRKVSCTDGNNGCRSLRRERENAEGDSSVELQSLSSVLCKYKAGRVGRENRKLGLRGGMLGGGGSCCLGRSSPACRPTEQGCHSLHCGASFRCYIKAISLKQNHPRNISLKLHAAGVQHVARIQHRRPCSGLPLAPRLPRTSLALRRSGSSLRLIASCRILLVPRQAASWVLRLWLSTAAIRCSLRRSCCCTTAGQPAALALCC